MTSCVTLVLAKEVHFQNLTGSIFPLPTFTFTLKGPCMCWCFLLMSEFQFLHRTIETPLFKPTGFKTSCHFSYVRLFVTPWRVACRAPLFMGFSCQEYWTGLLFPSSGDLPDAGIESVLFLSPALAGGFFIADSTWEA